MAGALSLNDGVLLISLLYLSIDMQYATHEFASCHWPVQRWLLVSYVFILAFRLTHVLGSSQMAAGSGDFLLNLRHKDTLPRLLMSITWLLVLPFFAVWTGIGTFWLYDSKRLDGRCLPMGMPLCFIITWQALSYAWILIHATLGGIAWVLERRIRKTEASLREMEDPDTLERWGQVSQLSGYTVLANNSMGGLAPDQIKQLPQAEASTLDLGEDCECPICLNEFEPSDKVRQLGTCGHTFHRSCIDLWLLRRADCPLCKRTVLCADNKSCSCTDAPVEIEQWHV
jgi:E3 ubiquitin-protein ligase SIS3